MNQYYSEELSQKTKRDMNEMRLKGNFIGGFINYGYSLNPIYAEVNGKQVVTATKVIVNEEEAPIVLEIFNEYAAGKKAVDIARELNDRGIKHRDFNFRASTVTNILRQEKYTGIYRIHGMAFENIYPAIVPIEIYNVVRARIEANRYGNHPKDGDNYLLKGKIYCGYCNKRMTSFTGTSKTGKIHRYYKCHKLNECKQSRTIRKDVLEEAITEALKNLLCTEEHFSFLLDKVLEASNYKQNDPAILKNAQKELSTIEKSLSNLLAAIEAGLLTETTKDRLVELEQRKRELKATIASEQSKEIKPPDKNKITQYLLFALSQPTLAMIDLLVQKVLLKDDTVDLYLKYSPDMTPDDKPRRGRPKQNEIPERNSSERGFLFMEYHYDYRVPIGRRSLFLLKDRHTVQKSLTVRIFL